MPQAPSFTFAPQSAVSLKRLTPNLAEKLTVKLNAWLGEDVESGLTLRSNKVFNRCLTNF